jgi:hypothetical protein
MIRLPITGLSNRKSELEAGMVLYDGRNVDVSDNSIVPIKGYTREVAETPGSVLLGVSPLLRWKTHKYYLLVRKNPGDTKASLYKYFPDTQTLTPVITNALDPSDFFFVQYADKCFAVNEKEGLRMHTIGENDFQFGQVLDAPAHPELMRFSDGIFRQGTDANQSLKTPLVNAEKIYSGEWGGRTGVTFTVVDDWRFDISMGSPSRTVDRNALLRYSVTFRLATPINLSRSDVFHVGIRAPHDRFSIPDEGSGFSGIRLELITVAGEVLEPIRDIQRYPGTRWDAYRRFYFFTPGTRGDRVSIKEIKISWELLAVYLTGIQPTHQTRLTFMVGDVWLASSVITTPFPSDPPRVRLKYQLAYKRFTSSLPSSEFESHLVPVHILGSYLKITVKKPQDWTSPVIPQVGDECSLLRDRRVIETLEYTASGWVLKGTSTGRQDVNGNLLFEDHNAVFDLPFLPSFEAPFLPSDIKPSSIGLFRASLVLGVGTDVFISRPNKPLEYEGLNEAPDPLDPGQGRSSFVSETRAEPVTGILGSKALYLLTPSRIYVMFGDFPATLSVPQPVDVQGVIGKRAFALFKNGIVFVNKTGVWFNALEELYAYDKERRDFSSLELTLDIPKSFAELGVTEKAFVLVQDGNLYVFEPKTSTTEGLVLFRKNNAFMRLTFPHRFVMGVADREEPMRLFTEAGGIYSFGTSSDFAGVSLEWYYRTGLISFSGDGNVPEVKSRMTFMALRNTGNVSVEVSSYDGKEGTYTKSYVKSPESFALEDFEPGIHHGIGHSVKISGTSSSKVEDVVFFLEPIGGGESL